MTNEAVVLILIFMASLSLWLGRGILLLKKKLERIERLLEKTDSDKICSLRWRTDNEAN